MCDFSILTEYMFAALVDLKAGRQVYLVVSKNPVKDDIEIEEVISSKSSSPETALVEHCQSSGLDMTNRRCIPVVLPKGLKSGDVGGFKAVHIGSDLHIEFTQ